MMSRPVTGIVRASGRTSRSLTLRLTRAMKLACCGSFPPAAPYEREGERRPEGDDRGQDVEEDQPGNEPDHRAHLLACCPAAARGRIASADAARIRHGDPASHDRAAVSGGCPPPAASAIRARSSAARIAARSGPRPPAGSGSAAADRPGPRSVAPARASKSPVRRPTRPASSAAIPQAKCSNRRDPRVPGREDRRRQPLGVTVDVAGQRAEVVRGHDLRQRGRSVRRSRGRPIDRAAGATIRTTPRFDSSSSVRPIGRRRSSAEEVLEPGRLGRGRQAEAATERPDDEPRPVAGRVGRRAGPELAGQDRRSTPDRPARSRRVASAASRGPRRRRARRSPRPPRQSRRRRARRRERGRGAPRGRPPAARARRPASAGPGDHERDAAVEEQPERARPARGRGCRRGRVDDRRPGPRPSTRSGCRSRSTAPARVSAPSGRPPAHRTRRLGSGVNRAAAGARVTEPGRPWPRPVRPDACSRPAATTIVRSRRGACPAPLTRETGTRVDDDQLILRALRARPRPARLGRGERVQRLPRLLELVLLQLLEPGRGRLPGLPAVPAARRAPTRRAGVGAAAVADRPPGDAPKPPRAVRAAERADAGRSPGHRPAAPAGGGRRRRSASPGRRPARRRQGSSDSRWSTRGRVRSSSGSAP